MRRRRRMTSDSPPPPLTFRYLATSGLKAGVLMYCRNSVVILVLRPSRLDAFTLRHIRSSSRSISSTRSRVS